MEVGLDDKSSHIVGPYAVLMWSIFGRRINVTWAPFKNAADPGVVTYHMLLFLHSVPK